MNERIHDLAKQYLVHERFTRYGESIEEDSYEFHPDELEEFVELIVKECAGVCETATQEGQPLHLVSIGYADRIKKHFGF